MVRSGLLLSLLATMLLAACGRPALEPAASTPAVELEGSTSIPVAVPSAPSQASPSGGAAAAVTITPVTPGTPAAAPPAVSVRRLVNAGLYFLDALHGWVIGERRTGVGCEKVLWRTTDGGRTWQAIIPPIAPASCPGENSDPREVHGLLFVSPRDGWAYGPGLYVTHDGGASWTDLNRGLPISALTVAGSTLWAIERQQCNQPMIACSWTFIVSRDGAVTWQPAPSQPDVRGPGLSLHWTSQHHGWLLSFGQGNTSRTVPSGGSTSVDAQLYVTDDGGVSWEPLPTPCRDHGGYSVQLAVVGKEFLWMHCSPRLDARTIQGSVTTSTDGGRTWGPLHVASSGPLSAPSDRDAFIQSRYGFVQRTRDGGRTWNLVVPPSQDVDRMTPDVSFVDPLHGWAMTPFAAVMRTDDGGAHWEVVDLP
jgi:photosystem II stability/assembly factor-like uncharacterized protein